MTGRNRWTANGPISEIEASAKVNSRPGVGFIRPAVARAIRISKPGLARFQAGIESWPTRVTEMDDDVQSQQDGDTAIFVAGSVINNTVSTDVSIICTATA